MSSFANSLQRMGTFLKGAGNTIDEQLSISQTAKQLDENLKITHHASNFALVVKDTAGKVSKKAKQIDETLKISEQASEFAATMKDNSMKCAQSAKDLNENFGLSQRASDFANVVKETAGKVGDSAKQFDEKYKISQDAKLIGWVIKAKATEVDEKLKITENAKQAATFVQESTIKMDEKLKISENAAQAATFVQESTSNINEKYGISEMAKTSAQFVSEKANKLDDNLKITETSKKLVNDSGLLTAFDKENQEPKIQKLGHDDLFKEEIPIFSEDYVSETSSVGSSSLIELLSSEDASPIEGHNVFLPLSSLPPPTLLTADDAPLNLEIDPTLEFPVKSTVFQIGSGSEGNNPSTSPVETDFVSFQF